jgi:hypothetical protein
MIGIGVGINKRRLTSAVTVLAPTATAATGIGQTSFTANWEAYSGATYYLLDVSESSDFSTFVYENQQVNAPTTSYVVIGLNSNTTYYYRVRASTEALTDADALAFFTRVTAAGGSLSTTEQDAIFTLVADLKADGIWSKMKAIYPMVGGGNVDPLKAAAACSQNLKSSSFTGTFSATGWTFASTGIVGNGTSTSFDTTIIPLNDLSQDDVHISFYSRTDNDQNGVDMGSERLTIQLYGGTLYYLVNNSSYVSQVGTPSNKFFLASRIISTTNKMYENGINTLTGPRNSQTMDSKTIRIGSWYDSSLSTNREYAFASIGDGLTDTEASDFYTAVQGFNQILNRNVGPQVVSDADAQAYINRVYNAGGTLTNTEANAVNQLTIDMKADGLWTKMKAVYPMVGASAAACAQNLKSASFTGTFSSGWTFASTGATPNGTSAYANTFINQNTLTTTSNHLSVYGGTSDTTRIHYSQGAKDNLFLQIANYILSRNLNIQLFQSGLTSNSGLILASRSSLNVTKLFRNDVELQSSTGATTNQTDSLIILGAVNDATFATISPVSYSNGEIRFNSIGDGLTNTEASDLYTAVQAFQTTLNREITP